MTPVDGLALYVGACQGYKCSCQAFALARDHKLFPQCSCGHARQTHAKEIVHEGEVVQRADDEERVDA